MEDILLLRAIDSEFLPLLYGQLYSVNAISNIAE